MHPLNSTNFGTHGLLVSFYNGTSVVNGYVTKQLGTNLFKVTDGTNTATVNLAPTTAIASALSSNPTYCTMLVYPSTSASGATFTVNYEVDSATLGSGGSGYSANDVLTLANSGGAQITVDTVNTGVIATFHVSNAGTGVTSLATNPDTVTGGTGSGATFNLKWKVLSITASGGTGYAVNEVLSFTGLVDTSAPTAHISAVGTNGSVSTVAVDSAGSGITTAATGVSVIGGPSEYVSEIYYNRVVTTAGNVYKWHLGSALNGGAFIATYS